MRADEAKVRAPGLTTMWHRDSHWNTAMDVLDGRETASLLSWLLQFWRLSRHRKAIILRGTVTLRERYRDLVGAALVRRLRRRPPLIVISDATFERRSRGLEKRLGRLALLIPAMARTVIRTCDGPTVRWCVLSRTEREMFSTTWGVPLERVVFTPFCHTLWNETELAPGPGVPSPLLRFFSGGNSLRDYDLLLTAFEDVPAALTIATDVAPARSTGSVTIRSMTHTEFLAQLKDCDVVVVSLAHSTRSAGQQTYLNGMALGKVTIVCDPNGAAADYIENGVTGVLADPSTLGEAMIDVLRPERAEHYAAMRIRAREVALSEFSSSRYTHRLLEVARLSRSIS